MSKTRDWLLNWLRERNEGELPAPLNHNGDAVFLSGEPDSWIDSFGVVELISAAEAEFSVKFSETDFQRRDFTTVNGFSLIVEDLCRNRSK